MIFSTNMFMFAFLPCCLLGYYVLFGKSRTKQNVFLLLSSMLFYSWGGASHTVLMLLSIAVNWLLALKIEKCREDAKARVILIFAVVFNLSTLGIFKYAGFLVENINIIPGVNLPVPSIALPIGISFFTFQAMSYVIDIYRGKGTALKNPLDLGLYISFFPQLIAGPIVRYEDISDQIRNRKETIDKITDGVFRFVYGLGKKVILADNVSVAVKIAFSSASPSLVTAWLGALAFTLQIYFDFSGYSDMAIGLGKMFGFEFSENFNYPYISSSVSEFWRRWHISMSTWFRDYVYIPLGGNRVSPLRRNFNLFVVWCLTGLWHGANWTFVIWGLLQFVAILLEKTIKINNESKSPVVRFALHGYTMLFVVLGWVFFNSESITDGIKYICNMFVNNTIIDYEAQMVLLEYGVFFLLGSFLCTPIYSIVKQSIKNTKVREIVECVVIIATFVLCIAYIAKGSYSPFIYFNF